MKRHPTSTSFITGTGLKKWSPPNLSFLPVMLAISVMGREDVLLANRVALSDGRERAKRTMTPRAHPPFLFFPCTLGRPCPAVETGHVWPPYSLLWPRPRAHSSRLHRWHPVSTRYEREWQRQSPPQPAGGDTPQEPMPRNLHCTMYVKGATCICM